MRDRFNESAVKVLTGEADPEEERQFREWLEQDALLQKEFDELKAVWEESAVYEHPSFAAADWTKLEDRISAFENTTAQEPVLPNTPAKAKQVFLNTVWQKMAIAASFILIAGLGWFIWQNNFNWESFEATAGNLEITLPDNSKVILKKGSTLKHAPNFEENRELVLSGEAFFEVTKDADHPFEVETGKTVTTVLGTSFGIHQKNETNTVEIRVVEGKVRFGAGKKNNLILTKGMAAGYNSKTGELKSIPFGSENEVSWAKNTLRFNNTPIREALNDIAHYYGIEIAHNLPEDYCPLTADFVNEEEKEIVKILTAIIELDIVVTSNKWTIQKGTCHK